MGRVKSRAHPSGRRGTRDQRYFPQLEDLKRALDRTIEETPRSTVVNASTNLRRSDEAIQEKLDKQAAKLARRARRAGHAPPTA